MTARSKGVKQINRTANRWPLGCRDPDSCSRHGRCMYIGCDHTGWDIRALAEAAKAREAAAKTKATKESVVEAELVRRVEALGGLCIKMQALGRRGFPDRLVALPGDNVVALAELKRPRGGVLSVHQQQYRDKLTALGVVIEVVADSADIERLLQRLLSMQKRRGPQRANAVAR